MNRLCRAAAVTTAVGALLVPLSTAQAASLVRADDVRFQYDSPEISAAGDHVTWHWTVVNGSAKAAHKVVVTHTISPQVPITHVTGPCTIDEARSAVKCTWDQLSAGQRTDGAIEAKLPEDLSGSVHIKGRITWQ